MQDSGIPSPNLTARPDRCLRGAHRPAVPQQTQPQKCWRSGTHPDVTRGPLKFLDRLFICFSAVCPRCPGTAEPVYLLLCASALQPFCSFWNIIVCPGKPSMSLLPSKPGLTASSRKPSLISRVLLIGRTARKQGRRST